MVGSAGPVGDDVGFGAAHHDEVAGGQRDRLARAGTSQPPPWVTATTARGASSSIRIDQGGSSTTFIRKAARARGPSRNAASASMPGA